MSVNQNTNIPNSKMYELVCSQWNLYALNTTVQDASYYFNIWLCLVLQFVCRYIYLMHNS